MMQQFRDVLIEFYSKIAAWYRRTTYKWFTPSNRLVLRNVEAGWVDRDDRLFHAMFTILCDFVEKEMDGPQKFRKILKKTQKDAKNDPKDVHLQVYYERMRILYSLYNWYTRIDWQDPVPESAEYSKMISETTYGTIEVSVGVHQLKIDTPNPAEYASERKIHAMKVQQFAENKRRRMHQLVRVYDSLWT